MNEFDGEEFERELTSALEAAGESLCARLSAWAQSIEDRLAALERQLQSSN